MYCFLFPVALFKIIKVNTRLETTPTIDVVGCLTLNVNSLTYDEATLNKLLYTCSFSKV